MKPIEYDAVCTVCGQTEIKIGDITKVNNSDPTIREDFTCPECKWKENFDSKLCDVIAEDVDTKDYPEFCDAYCGPESEYDGKIMEDWQCEWIDENYPELVNEAAFEKYL